MAGDGGGMSGAKLWRTTKLGGVGGRAVVRPAGLGEMATAAGHGSAPELQAPCRGPAHCSAPPFANLPGELPPHSPKKYAPREGRQPNGAPVLLLARSYVHYVCCLTACLKH